MDRGSKDSKTCPGLGAAEAIKRLGVLLVQADLSHSRSAASVFEMTFSADQSSSSAYETQVCPQDPGAPAFNEGNFIYRLD